jgi:uncharacterized membrane protein
MTPALRLAGAWDAVAQQHFLADFRSFFLRGLGALVPTLLTFAIIVWAYRLINDNVGHYITQGLLEVCSLVREEPAPGFVDPKADALRYGTKMDEWDEEGHRLTVEHKIIQNYSTLTDLAARNAGAVSSRVLSEARKARNDALWRIAFAKYKLHLLGFLIAIILVYFMGFFLASFLGRTSWRAAERLLHRIPLIRAIYPNIKQVTDFLLTERSVGFSGVVAVEYPRKGIWAVGLSTGGPMTQLQQRVSGELVSIFIPSSPTPVTGYVIQVPKEDVIELNLTIDEGLRFTISAGVIKPEAALPGPASGKEKV